MNRLPGVRKFVLFLLLILAALLMAACLPSEKDATNTKEFQPMENEQLYAARDTGQIIVKGDKLRIGVGNIWKENYVNQTGENVNSVRAGLWLFFKENQDADSHFRVYQDQVIAAEGYRIRVVEINEKDKVVVLGVTPPSE